MCVSQGQGSVSLCSGLFHGEVAALTPRTGPSMTPTATTISVAHVGLQHPLAVPDAGS